METNNNIDEFNANFSSHKNQLMPTLDNNVETINESVCCLDSVYTISNSKKDFKIEFNSLKFQEKKKIQEFNEKK